MPPPPPPVVVVVVVVVVIMAPGGLCVSLVHAVISTHTAYKITVR